MQTTMEKCRLVLPGFDPPPVSDLRPGLNFRVPEEVYRRAPAMNQSILKVGGRSMAHLHQSATTPEEATDPMDFGTAFHAAILEPGRFSAEYVVEPKWPRLGNNHLTPEAKVDRAKFLANNPKAKFIDSDDMHRLLAMQRSVFGHPCASKLLATPGPIEVAALWRDEATGIWCKARLDKFIKGVFALDFKTARDASPIEFEKVVYNLGYFQQAAWYIDGFKAATGEETDLQLVVTESEPPHLTAVYAIDDDALDAGRSLNRELLGQYASCLRSGVWTGYGPGDKPMCTGIPAWAARRQIGGAA
jgi:hypothetical protein